jgi:hypothetical protein
VITCSPTAAAVADADTAAAHSRQSSAIALRDDKDVARKMMMICMLNALPLLTQHSLARKQLLA